MREVGAAFTGATHETRSSSRRLAATAAPSKRQVYEVPPPNPEPWSTRRLSCTMAPAAGVTIETVGRAYRVNSSGVATKSMPLSESANCSVPVSACCGSAHKTAPSAADQTAGVSSGPNAQR